MTDETKKPEPWPVRRSRISEEIVDIGPLEAESVDIGPAYQSREYPYITESEPGAINRVARLPVTEWERDRAVELIKSAIAEAQSDVWGAMDRLVDFVREIEGGERG